MASSEVNIKNINNLRQKQCSRKTLKW